MPAKKLPSGPESKNLRIAGLIDSFFRYLKILFSRKKPEHNSLKKSIVNYETVLPPDAATPSYFEAVFNTIKQPLAIVDKQLRIKNANASFYKYFKTSRTETNGKTISDIITVVQDAGSIIFRLPDVLTGKEHQGEIEVTLHLPDGAERYVLLNAKPLVHDKINEGLFLITVNDITESRAVNVQLQDDNLKLEENNKELTAFSYMASHDLQDPMRKIYTFSRMITDDKLNKLSEDSKLYLERIMVSAGRMQQLINDLLNYSYISNADTDDVRAIDLNLLLEEVLAEIKEHIDEKQAAVTIEKLPQIMGIPMLVRQLFTNLIGNSLKYSKKDNIPVITVSSSIASMGDSRFDDNTNTRYHKITVSDNGIGFAREQSERIFEPFQRLHTKDKYEGTGIGLAICKKIVLKHEGFINAESNPGEGTEFNVFLPLKESHL